MYSSHGECGNVSFYLYFCCILNTLSTVSKRIVLPIIIVCLHDFFHGFRLIHIAKVSAGLAACGMS